MTVNNNTITITNTEYYSAIEYPIDSMINSVLNNLLTISTPGYYKKD